MLHAHAVFRRFCLAAAFTGTLATALTVESLPQVGRQCALATDWRAGRRWVGKDGGSDVRSLPLPAARSGIGWSGVSAKQHRFSRYRFGAHFLIPCAIVRSDHGL